MNKKAAIVSWLIVLPLSIMAFMAATGFVAYLLVSGWLLNHDNQRLAEMCATDAENGCPLLWQDYTNTKRENERLKLQVRECTVLINQEIED